MNSRTTKRIPSYIGGMFAILAGVFFILYPEMASGVIGILFGVVLFVAGITEVIGYIISINQFKQENYGKAAGAEIVLVYSIIIMAIGIVFMLKPNMVLHFLSAFVGLFFMIDGIVKARREIFLFKSKDINSWVLLFLALALIASGIALICNAFRGTLNVIVFTGAALILSGVETCLLSFVRKFDKTTRKD